MADSVTTVTRTSWFQRLKNSVGGIFFGILLIIVACIILFKNEGRAVKTAKGLKEGIQNVISLPSPVQDAQNENKLVHLFGPAEVHGTLSDEEFHIEANAVHYSRSIDMYQWVENEETKKVVKPGGAEETTTTYTYTKDWRSNVVSSSSFEEQAGHENPDSMPINDVSMSASSVTVGDFNLSSSLISKISNYQPITPTEKNIEGMANASLSGNYVFMGKGSMGSPEIGDVRISFEQVLPQQVSIVATQTGNNLTPYLTSQNTTIELLSYGVVPADLMFKKAQQKNKTLTWILRLVGFLMIFFGFKMIFAPIGVLVSVLPFLGRLANFGTGIVSFLLTLAIAVAVIAVGWIVYRPVLGISLLVISVGSIVAIRFLKSKQGVQAN